MDAVSGVPFKAVLSKGKVNVEGLIGMVRSVWMGRRRRIGKVWW